jgi:flagellar hook-length control protein FliK
MQARVVVEPPSMGRVDIAVQVSRGGMDASFQVEGETLRKALLAQMGDLRSSLEAQGITVGNLSVDVRSGGEGRQNPGGGASSSRRGRGFAEGDRDGSLTEGTQEILRLDLDRGTLHWVA